MMNQQLYVDGVLMDITEDMSITLDIKSNLFRDVTNIKANNTYTVNLPKTAHNMAVLEHSDKPKSLSKFPYNFHVCRYFRNGVEIIKDGRLTLMSVADSIEVAIYWGIFPAFTKLQEDDVQLDGLGVTNRCSFNKYNIPNTRAEAIALGVFYAYYNPYIIQSKDDTFGANFVQGKNVVTRSYNFVAGKIKTGTKKGAYIGGRIVTDTSMYCLLVPFYPTMRATFAAAGVGDYGSYAILDKNMYIVAFVGETERLQNYTIDAPANASYLVINAKASYFGSTPQLVMSGQFEMRESFSPFSQDEDFVGDDVMAGSEYKSSPKYLQPCVMVSWLLQVIKNKTGVSFVWSGEANEVISSLVVPIIKNQADENTVVGNMLATLNPSSSLTDLLSFTFQNSITAISTNNGSDINTIAVKTDCTLAFDMQIQYSLKADNEVWLSCPLYIEMKVLSYDNGETSEQTYEIGLAKYDDGQNRFEVEKPSDRVDGYLYKVGAGFRIVELKANDKITFKLCRAGIDSTPFYLYAGKISAKVSNGDSVPFGGSFPIGINLPEIKVLDFIRFLSLVTGSFPRQLNDTDKVEFVEYSKVWENRDKAVDWSSRLIPLEARNTPRKSEFAISDYRKLNHYKWKEDEQTHTENDADLVIDNATLEYEQDVWTLPFAASDGNRIPIRSVDDVGSKNGGEYKACEERVMTLRSDKEQAALSFDIDLQNIFATKYDQLAKSLSRAHVITEHLYLSELEIMNFDETIPVYLAQYGAYFAVLELKVTDSGYTEATMIQLEF